MADIPVAQQGDATDEAPPNVPQDYLAEVDLEHARWSEITALGTHAATARAYMLQHWFARRAPSDAANWWVRKAGAEHYGEHLPPLRTWVAELVDARTRPPSDEWDS